MMTMYVDDWKYFDADDYVVVVNNFADDSETRIQTNVYVALKKDIEKEVSVHDVMKEIEEMI